MANYIELDLEVLHMTGDALFLSDGVVEEWVPRTLVNEGSELGADDIDKTMTIELEEWMAIKKGFV